MTKLKSSSGDYFEKLKYAMRVLFLSLGCSIMMVALIMAKLIKILPKGIDPLTLVLIIGISSFLGLMIRKNLHSLISTFITFVFSMFLSGITATLPVTLGIISGEEGLIFQIYIFSWLIVNYGVLFLIFMPLGCILGCLMREAINL